MLTLRDKTGLLPGGVIYQDPRTPGAVWYDTHTFLDGRVAEVLAFRKANPTVYPEAEWTNYDFIKAQLVEFNCRRIGFNPEFCFETTTTATNPAPVGVPLSTRLCPNCGATLVPTFCKTCGGAKITGYNCQQCKKDYPK
jgi:hypothetical protein